MNFDKISPAELVDSLIDGMMYAEIRSLTTRQSDARVPKAPSFSVAKFRKNDMQVSVNDVVVILTHDQHAASEYSAHDESRTNDPLSATLETFRNVCAPMLQAPSLPFYTQSKTAAMISQTVAIGVVTRVFADYDYTMTDDNSTMTEVTYVPWVAAVVDVSAAVNLRLEEIKLTADLHNTVKRTRKAQMVRAMFGDSVAALTSPLVNKTE